MRHENFNYKNGILYCENVDLNQLAEAIGTPFYVYSKKTMVDRFRDFEKAFEDIPHQTHYAVKSNSNINIIRLFCSLGAGLDVNSGGELYRALKAGAKPEKILFTGVGKTDEEILMGLKNNIFLFKIESLQELELLNELAKKQNKVANIAIRINPNVNPKTHPYITTGLYESKFGIDQEAALDAFKIASRLPNIKILGIDMHIGSQITDVSAFREAIIVMNELIQKLRDEGIQIEHFDVGGGLGVQYNDEPVPDVFEYANTIKDELKKSNCKIIFEPGRYLTADAGALISKTLYVKNHREKNFLVVDAAVNDLMRPALYNAYHEILPVVQSEREKLTYDIVGPACETGDFFAKNREFIQTNRDELIAIMSAGAYGFCMSSNYNSRRRVAEILVDDDKFYIIRERETFEDLIRGEKIIDEIYY
ncbi:MAG: diaminopimelate decarboxylase [Ignavibacteria bacterium]|jgi:diaminopimelate decarboxylase|nr:diaminopimelate decarboxylase [Ignavibacteria bacterium]MDH7527781.1 diaminopimelate decarboxylase [Ignavibacteria bacterium]